MQYIRVWVVILLLAVSVSAEEVLAAQLCRDSYGTTESFRATYGSRFKVAAFEENGVRFYALSDKERQIIVFRGTDNLSNWLTNLKTAEHRFAGAEGAMVHAGFYAVAESAIKRLHPDKARAVTVTGHSLGGAAALLYGALLHDSGYDVTVITFGAPPVGNEAFAEAVTALSHTRFEHIMDAVPKADQKAVATLKKLLDSLDETALEQGRLRQLIAYFKTMPYGFVQQGDVQQLTHLLEMREFSAQELLVQPLRYHGMESYMMGFMEGEEP